MPVPFYADDAPYVNFESGPVRPVALSPDGQTLFVTNIPDGQLEIYNVTDNGLSYRASVPVGLEPVAVAPRSDGEVWVVNHLSDSVSVVDVDAALVTRTLLVGDAPRDIVFAQDRAFITTAHRGQHRTDASIAKVPGAGDPQLTTEGVGRADVWVFDAAAPGAALGGVPLSIVVLFGDTPRGLAVSADGGTVYAAVHHSGNGTTVISEGSVCDGFASAGPCLSEAGLSLPGGNPGPAQNFEGENAPEVGLIVKYDWDLGQWLDELQRSWNDVVMFELPDYDVFAIDVATLAPGDRWPHVGTTLFNLAVNPVSGVLYVTNTDSHNEVRFEGPGVFGGSTVQGRLAEARITVIDGTDVVPRHLNPHIDYELRPAPAGTSDYSLATPLDVAVSSDGGTLYVAAFGSSQVGVFSTAALEGGALDPTVDSASYLDTAGGPAGLALDEARDRLYVYTRFDNAVAAIDLATGAEIDKAELPNPEPVKVWAGRAFLYDARLSSSNGEASCAACHTFADFDHLAWDLGNPDDIDLKLGLAAGSDINGTGNPADFHPMKGPMSTQTLKGLQFSGAQHWRGDRSVGVFGADPYDSELSFMNFAVAFEGLLGRETAATEPEMTLFTDFAMTLALPPNPVRNLDGGLTAEQRAAFEFYTSTTRVADGIPIGQLGFSCDGCHTLDPSQGFFGTNGEQSFENETQIMKIPHLRNAYEKVGMFGMIEASFFEPGDNGATGEQVRGVGFLHDGSVDTLFRFFRADVFQNGGPNIGFRDDDERRAMEALMLAFDSDLAAVVGQQVTLDTSDDVDRNARADLLVAAAVRSFPSALLGGTVTQCDVVAHTAGRGFVYDGSVFVPDDGSAPLTLAELQGMTAEAPVTLTAVVPGTGWRRGVDRDGDGVLNGLDSCPYWPNADAQDLPCPDLEETTPGTTDTGTTNPGTTDGGATTDDTGVEGKPLADTGCGCASGPSGATGWLLTGLGAAWLRRRRLAAR
jgi:MYXO-CTERM domain-containing protein